MCKNGNKTDDSHSKRLKNSCCCCFLVFVDAVVVVVVVVVCLFVCFVLAHARSAVVR